MPLTRRLIKSKSFCLVNNFSLSWAASIWVSFLRNPTVGKGKGLQPGQEQSNNKTQHRQLIHLDFILFFNTIDLFTRFSLCKPGPCKCQQPGHVGEVIGSLSALHGAARLLEPKWPTPLIPKRPSSPFSIDKEFHLSFTVMLYLNCPCLFLLT